MLKPSLVGTYYEEGDIVSAVFSLLDTSSKVLHPERIELATLTLSSKERPLLSVKFDKFFGNSDGMFYLFFSHPPKTENLGIELLATLTGNQTIRVKSNVEVKRMPDKKLAPNPNFVLFGDQLTYPA